MGRARAARLFFKRENFLTTATGMASSNQHLASSSRGTALSPAAHRRREAGAGVTVASGQVISLRQPSFGPPSLSDRENAHRRFGVPSASIRTNCKGMSVHINGIVRTIDTDSGYSWSGWPLVRQITVSQAFPFPVEPGMAFTVTARPSADLSWDQLHIFRNAQIEGQRRDNSSLISSIFWIILALIGHWLFMQHAVILGSGPMQTVVGTWSSTSWMVHMWKGYSPAVINVPDTLFLRIAWQTIVGLVTFLFFVSGVRGFTFWSMANLSMRTGGGEAQAKVKSHGVAGQAGDASERTEGARKHGGSGKSNAGLRGLSSPNGHGNLASSMGGPNARSHGSVIGGAWTSSSPSAHGPASPYAPISQSMLGSPSGFSQSGFNQASSSPMGAPTVLGSPQGRTGLVNGTPRGVHFASPVASARVLMSPSSPLGQAMSTSIFSSPMRSPSSSVPHDRSHAFGEWCEKRRTRLEDSKDSSFNLRHNSPLQASKSPFSTSLNNTMGFASSSLNMTSPQSLSTTQLGRSAAQTGGSTLDESSAVVLSSSPVDRKYAWWLERPNGALIYLRELIADRGIAADPQSLLSQCAHGVRTWLSMTVLGQVSALMAQVDHDAARGLHKEQPAVATAAAPAASGFGAPAAATTGFGATSAFGGGFGAGAGGAFGGASTLGAGAAQTQQTAQQQQKEATQKAEAQRRAEAIDRRARLKEYLTMSRFPEPDKSAGIGGMRVQTYIRKRIKELAVGKGLLAYTWDGGSADYAECVVNSTERTIYDSHHHSFSSYRNPQMPNNSVDSSRFFPADGRAKMVWPQHELGQSGTISTSPRALPTDAELMFHVFCTYMDHKLRPAPHPKKQPAAAAAAAAAKPAGTTIGLGGFGGAGPTLGAGGFGGSSAFGMGSSLTGAASASAAGAGAAAANADLTPNLKDTHWFTSEHILAANPMALARRPHRGAHVQSITDVSRNLKSKPFIEEKLGHDPDCPQKMCPQLVVCMSAKRAASLHHQPAGAHEQASLPDRIVAVEVQPGPDNLFQAIAVMAVEAKVNCRSMIGSLDLSHPSLNLMSFIPNLG